MHIRMLNGYRVLYKPDYPRCMTTDNWCGYVYEHILVAEETLRRPLHMDEVVHHLDEDKANNRRENLLVILRSQHAKLHAWLSKGAPRYESSGENRVNSRNPNTFCQICSATLQERQESFCSEACRGISVRRASRPPLTVLRSMVADSSLSAVGRHYGVSGNAIKKWLNAKETMSQANSTLLEGAETTGEVKPS